MSKMPPTTIHGPSAPLTLHFGEAKDEQILSCHELAGIAFGKPLSSTDYIARENFMMRLASKQGGQSWWRIWCVFPVEDPSRVLASCKTIRRDMLVKGSFTGEARHRLGYCISSVVVDSAHRGLGKLSELTFWLVSKSGWTQKERRLWACCIAARKMLVYTKTLVISGLMILSPVLFEEWLDSCICPRTVSPHWKCLPGNQSGLSQITTHQNITCKGCQPSLWKRHSSIKFRNLPTKGFARRNRHDSPAYRRADRLAPRPGRILRTQSFRRDTSEQRCHLWRRFMDFLASRLPKAMSVRPTYTVLGTGREDEDPLLGCVVKRCLPWGRGLGAFMLGHLGY